VAMYVCKVITVIHKADQIQYTPFIFAVVRSAITHEKDASTEETYISKDPVYHLLRSIYNTVNTVK